MKKIIWGACLFLSLNIVYGCTILPIIPVVGTVFGGYVNWKERETVKYYAADITTMHQAVILSSQQLHLKVAKKSTGKKGHYLEVKCKEPLQIEILPFDKKVTKVVIKRNILGDKQFVQFFYQKIDANLAKIRRV